MGGDEYKTIWKGRVQEREKKWGSETTIGSMNQIQAKVLFIDKGKSTSLKYYTQKSEILYVKKGKIFVEYDSEKFHWQDECHRKLKEMILSEGQILYVQSGCPYKITAVENSEIIEIGDKSVDTPVKLELEET